MAVVPGAVAGGFVVGWDGLVSRVEPAGLGGGLLQLFYALGSIQYVVDHINTFWVTCCVVGPKSPYMLVGLCRCFNTCPLLLDASA